ncbi:hypothetical protein DY000_02039892 [Brassica cretica]|uniref:Uncharacterized protein n=1 Tax=Brassica cretica TaxID=69181 RepID=A0ABQ7BGU4_BRACR|nr:hypothetical protein DY000_02039892 [Brassica cretica]
MGDHGNQDDLAAAMALMQQQMQQTMNAREQAAQAAAELAAQRQQQQGDTDRSMKVSSVGTSRMDELSAKMDQLIMSNQNPIFIMEDSLLQQSVKDTALDTDKPAEDQQDVSYVNGQGWQFNNYHPNPNVRNNPHLFGHNTKTDNPDRAQNTGYQKYYPQKFSERTFILSKSTSEL